MALAQTLARLVSTLGNAGAQANAYRACEDRKLTEARIDALARRLGHQVVRDRTWQVGHQ
ncbi:MAG TPA: hypothetical protein VM143_09865 [Acidimicrobiales bacterium]|nr:hypothetical protein [Acidimicrobiales bacterium]